MTVTKAARAILIALGVGLSAYGAWLLIERLTVPDLLWLAVWLAGAIVIHDGVIAPALAVLRRRWDRDRPRRPLITTATAQIGFAVGAVLTLYVAPELWAQARMPANPTILTGDYALRLLVVWGIIAVTVLLVSRFARRSVTPPTRH